MSTLGSRSATVDGRSRPRNRSDTVRLTRAAGVDRDPRRQASDLVAGPVDEQAVRGQSARCTRSQAAGDLVLGVLTQHVERAHDRGPAHPPPSGTSNPPSRNVRPSRSSGLAARDPLRVDLDADDLDVGAHPRQPVVQLHAVTGRRAVAEVDDDGRLGAAPQPPRLRAREPPVHRRSRFGLVVPRVTMPTGR